MKRSNNTQPSGKDDCCSTTRQYTLNLNLDSKTPVTKAARLKRKISPKSHTAPQEAKQAKPTQLKVNLVTKPNKKLKKSSSVEEAKYAAETNMSAREAIEKLKNNKRKQEQRQEQQQQKDKQDRKEKQTQRKWKQTKISIYTAGKQDKKRKPDICRPKEEYEHRNRNKQKTTK